MKAAFAEHSLLAAILWDKEELVAQHIANGADLAARDPLGRTALMAAIEHGFPSIVAALLAAGAKPELADARGRTALALACVKVGSMERLSGGETGDAESEDGIAVGSWVKVTVTFTSDSSEGTKVPKGLLGKVRSAKTTWAISQCSRRRTCCKSGRSARRQ